MHTCSHSECLPQLWHLVWFSTGLPSLTYRDIQGLDDSETSNLSQNRLTLTEPKRSRTFKDGAEGAQVDRESSHNV